MELKDVILSTIAELGEDVRSVPPKGENSPKSVKDVKEEISKSVREERDGAQSLSLSDKKDFIHEEREYLEHLRERILVLFEGFQSPNNKRVEAKIDLTLNFLEYLLALLDERIETLKKP
ncbi:hypothetical protein [Hydrogenimonas sp.]|uniref:CiaD-like domain-containing protein n=1 Tax=Hydrogenimonas sp. TaxID=2231112 RepID=UPI00262BEE53|nr:hypothetical protein [Hydrogenimonas sp.]